jgi:hypothetical protein
MTIQPELSSRTMSPAVFSSSVSSRGLRRATTALSLLALAALAGCSASADIPEVVVTRSDVAFEGVPYVPGITDVSQSVTTSFEHPSDFELPSGLNPELRPRSASITGRGTMQDLSFLEGLTVTLSSRAPDAPDPQVVASYERTRTSGVGRVVPLEVDPDSDVLAYWDTKQAFYEVTLWGVMPPEDWAIDVTFSFEGHLSVSSSD